MGPHKLKLLKEALQNLIDKQAIEPAAPSIDFYAHIFLVPKKRGKMHPVFNMKLLNWFIVACSCKMVMLKMVCCSFWEEDFVVSLDLPDAYFHVQIAPDFQRFLHFKLEGQIFQFTAMPFSLGSAPRVFT